MPFLRRAARVSPRVQAVLDGVGATARPGESESGAAGGPVGGAGRIEPWEWVPVRADIGGDVRGPQAPPPTTGETRSRVRYAGRHRRGPKTDRPLLLAVPAPLREARYAVSVPAVLGALLVVVVGVAGFGGRVAWAEWASRPSPAGATPGGGADDGVESTGSGSGHAAGGVDRTGDRSAFGAGGPEGSGATSPAGLGRGEIVVHVVGRVRHPGVVHLAAGSRVEDAIAEAGGATRDADLSGVNLARVLADGEQLRVPRPGETVSPLPGSDSGATAAGGGASVPVNINTADESALDGLPGVGPVLAGRIIAWRTEHGRFTSVSELGEVSGIGEKVLAGLADLVTV